MTGPWAVEKAKKAGISYAISPLPTIGGKKMTPFVGGQMFYVSAKAKSDGAQSLTPDQFDALMNTIKPELEFFGKTLN